MWPKSNGCEPKTLHNKITNAIIVSSSSDGHKICFCFRKQIKNRKQTQTNISKNGSQSWSRSQFETFDVGIIIFRCFYQIHALWTYFNIPLRSKIGYECERKHISSSLHSSHCSSHVAWPADVFSTRCFVTWTLESINTYLNKTISGAQPFEKSNRKQWSAFPHATSVHPAPATNHMSLAEGTFSRNYYLFVRRKFWMSYACVWLAKRTHTHTHTSPRARVHIRPGRHNSLTLFNCLK